MAYTGSVLRSALSVLAEVPDGTFFNCNNSTGYIEFQGKAAMGWFPGVVWRKEFSEGCQWWEYYGEYKGVKIRIYADYEGPAACTKITETVEVEVDEPVTTRKVKRLVTRVRWECPEEPVAAPEVAE